MEPGRSTFGIPDTGLFSTALDHNLRRLNSDYDAKRTADLVLGMPKVTWAAAGAFENMLKQKGKLGGQHKVPRLSMDPRWVEAVCGDRNLLHPVATSGSGL